MSQSKIKLNATEEVQEFVNAASRCDFDILHFYNRIIIAEKTGLEDELLQIRFFCIMTVFRVIP